MQSNKVIFRLIFGIIFYSIAVLSVVILIKTELRKWIVFEGEPTSSNTIIFWFSLIAAIFFVWVGSKVWPHKKGNSSNNKNG